MGVYSRYVVNSKGKDKDLGDIYLFHVVLEASAKI